MNKWLLLYGALFLLGVAVTVLCGVQLVMAIRCGEIGRVLFYFVLSVLLVELAVFSIMHIVNIHKK